MVQRIKKWFHRPTRLESQPTERARRRNLLPSSSSYFHRLTEEEERKLAKRFEGKLLLRREIPLSDPQFNDLLRHQLFTPHPSFIKTIFQIRCKRCNNDKPSLLASFPCAKCCRTHLYCRNCIMMGRVSECEVLYEWNGIRYQWPTLLNACTWKGVLTPAQEKAANLVKKAIADKSEMLVWAVAGAGKTEILFPGIELALSRGARICIATPRSDVVRELYPRIGQAFKNVEVEALYGKKKNKDGTAQIIIATTHQLLRFNEAFDVMIIDEIDAFPYHKDRSLAFATNRAAKKASAKIYLTATPRGDLKQKIRRKQLPHCFIPIRYHGHPLPEPKLVADFSLSKRLTNKQLPKSFIRWLDQRERKTRQLLIFVPTIQLAEQLKVETAAVLLLKKLIKDESEVAFAHAEDELREEKVRQFRQRNIYCLLTTTILERGVTFPSVDVVVLQANHDVFDEAALVQISGRAGRAKDDPDGEVIFIHDGKTEALVDAVHAIKKMNLRAKTFYTKESER